MLLPSSVHGVDNVLFPWLKYISLAVIGNLLMSWKLLLLSSRVKNFAFRDAREIVI